MVAMSSFVDAIGLVDGILRRAAALIARKWVEMLL